MSQAFARARGEGRSFRFLGHDFTETATTDETGGAFSLHEIVQRAGGEPPMHVHHREDEGFYVLDGTLTFHVGDDRLPAPAGTFVFLPRGVPHSFTVDSGEARLLQLCAPGGLDPFFAAWGDRPPEPAAMAAALAPFGVEVVGPPPRS